MSITDLLTRCVNHSLPDVVRQVIEERRRAAAQFLREEPKVPWKAKRPPPDT